MNHIKENCSNERVYFHNLGGFDFMFLIEYLVNNDATEKVNLIERNNHEVSIKQLKPNILFLSTGELDVYRRCCWKTLDVSV